jgi:hypothetical protein
MHTVLATARFVRHAMRLRGERIAGQVPAAPVTQPGVGGNIALTDLLCHAQRWLCMLLLIMYGGGWLLGVILCLHGLLKPVIGSHPNHTSLDAYRVL